MYVGICFNLKKFLTKLFPQREVAANSQNGEEIVPVLTLRFLITQLEAALRNIQATNYTVSVFFWKFEIMDLDNIFQWERSWYNPCFKV